MAITEYQDHEGQTRWKVSVSIRSQEFEHLRIQKSKFGLKTFKQAEREEAQLLRACHQEILQKETQGSSWGAVVDAWHESMRSGKIGKEVSEETLSDTIRAFENHTFHWWKRSAKEITRLQVEELFNQLKARGSTNGFIARMKDRINMVFRFGIEHGLIRGVDRSPAYGIQIKKREFRKPEILSIDQIRKLLEEAKRMQSRWYPIWAVALLTGMRNGELYALLWSDIDWENREIAITKSYNARSKKVKSTKSGDWRVVPISSELYHVLREIQAEAGDRPHVLPHFGEWQVGGQAAALRMFCMGIGLPSIRFHTLRACFATQLIRSGVAPIRIQKVCGWKDLDTMQRYIRLAGIEIEGATENLKVLPVCDVMSRAGGLFAGS